MASEPHPLSALDAPAWTLVHDLTDALVPVRQLGPDGPAVLLFRSASAARAHLERLPNDAPSVRMHAWSAEDRRAQEEWLRAADAAGARWVAIDPPPGGSPAARLPLARVLAYVLSYKRGTACL